MVSAILPRQSRATRVPAQPASALRMQSSVAGAPRAVGWGQQRLAGNLILAQAFTANPITASAGGGSFSGGSFTSGYTYTVSLAAGLAEGPIDQVVQCWNDKIPASLSSQGITIFDGDYQQGPWGYLVASFPAYAQNFRGLAYAAAANFALGTSSSVPNLTFETRFAINAAVTETTAISSGLTYQALYYDATASGAAEMTNVPYAAPFTVQAQNWQGLPFTQTYLADLASTTLSAYDSAGVFYTDTGDIPAGTKPSFLTRVTGSPSGGQYTDNGAGLYTFSAADAGAAITIVDLAVSPGVNFVVAATGDLDAGSALITELSTVTGVAPGMGIAGDGIAAGARVSAVYGGNATGSLSAGSVSVSLTSGSLNATPGSPISDASGAISAGTTIAALGGPVATLSASAGATVPGDTFFYGPTIFGTLDQVTPNTIDVASTAGIVAGMAVSDADGQLADFGSNWSVVSTTGTTVAVADPAGDVIYGFIDTYFTFTGEATGNVANGSDVVTQLSAALPVGVTLTDSGGALAAGTTVASVSTASLVLSEPATASATSDALTVPSSVLMSLPAMSTGSNVAVDFIGAALEQVLIAPATGQFTLSADGVYGFSPADAGAPTGTTLFLTSGSSWTVPPGVTALDSVECIGGGGGGAGYGRGGGGGGGGYAKGVSISVTPGAAIPYNVGAGGAGGPSNSAAAGSDGGDTWFGGVTFSAATAAAKGGQGGNRTSGGQGGQASAGIGATRYSGGSSPADSLNNGGGGAAGPAGPGGAGGDGNSSGGGGQIHGAGGGGANNGTAGGIGDDSAPPFGEGGNGGNSGPGGSGSGGLGDGRSGNSSGMGLPGTNGGGGGGGGYQTAGGAGGNGTEWDAAHGSGGGGGSSGSGASAPTGGAGGLYGGGGGTGGDATSAFGGNGAPGLIVIVYSQLTGGKQVRIIDVPDANPADVLYDCLTNPYYGLTQFPADRVGDLSLYRDYCAAAGLFVSPVLASQSGADQFIADLMTATNSEIVWSGGLLTVVPYGDQAITGNGASYAPPTAPLYSLDDDDYLPNEATNSASVSAAESPDPVTVTRLRPADQINDIQIEYLDRTNNYNPTIAEAQDDAAIDTFGLKTAGTKQLHMFCERTAALGSAQLQLGRQQLRNLYAFTVGREYVLLDPMDIVAITDAGLGLSGQWVRITEITENDDRSLSLIAEDYLLGSGSVPRYGVQGLLGGVGGPSAGPNYGVAPGNALAPVIIDVPAQLVQTLGVAAWIATNGGPNWGGCEVWLSSDNVSFSYVGTMQGGAIMGTLSATFPTGSDPDTANTLSVDLTESRGSLLAGTKTDADDDNTLAYVDGEYVSYEQATLTAQYQYNLGKNGSTAGYLRRGQLGSTIAAHAAGTNFVRLKKSTLFELPYVAAQIGNTYYVKLRSFNIFGGGAQALEEVASYAHTIGGSAPALSDIGALALYSDLEPGAATNTASATASSATATATSSTVTSVTLSVIGGQPVAIQAQANVGAGSGSPAPTWIEFFLTVSTGTDNSGEIALPTANTVLATPQWLDTPSSAGAITYTLAAQCGGGGGTETVPLTNISLTATELRR